MFFTFKLKLTHEETAPAYLSKMEKFAKKLLAKKFFKTNLYESITDFALNIYDRYLDLDVSTNNLANQSKKTTKKETQLIDKLKKDAKNLNAQKCKFISDLMKELTFMGLSYRKGQINHAENNQELGKTLLFERASFYAADNELQKSFRHSEYNYYLCSHNFLTFKALLSSQNTNTDTSHLNAIPFQKLIGYTDHFYHVIHEQKVALHKCLNKLSHFQLLSDIVEIVLKSKVFDNSGANNRQDKVNSLNEFMSKTLALVEQIELFFSMVGKNCVDDVTRNNSINASFLAISQKMECLKNSFKSSEQPVLFSAVSSSHGNEDYATDGKLMTKLKFTCMDDVVAGAVKSYTDSFAQDGDLNKCLIDLTQTANAECKPFSKVFEQIKEELNELNLNQQRDFVRQETTVVIFINSSNLKIKN